ncbi:TPA: dsDNA-mimic protein, partial [Escherichia coli]|nr:dsDNA-mimic protein [Escherichia coli]
MSPSDCFTSSARCCKTSPTEVKQVVTMDMDLNNRLTEDET